MLDILVTRRVVERTTRYEQRLDIQSNESQSSLVKTTYEPRKKPSYFPLYWMVNRDPYNGLL